jgi:hypothetical protein
MKGVIPLIEPPQVGLERLLGDPEIDPWHHGQNVQSGYLLVA